MDSPRRRSTLLRGDHQAFETLIPRSSSSSGVRTRESGDASSSRTNNDAEPRHSGSLLESSQRKVNERLPTRMISYFAFLSRYWLKLRQCWKDFIEYSWAWEMCGMFLSISCMVAILATLPYLSEHPLSNWQFLLAPNTMISTFITVMKTTMLLVVAEGIGQLKWTYFMADAHPIAELQRFDIASRGPWGSLRLLLYAGKKSTLASFGAIITIAALAMDPFGQQIITFETRYVPRNEINTAIPVAYAYDLTGGPSYNWDLMGAASAAFFNQSRPLPMACPTGNCTWPAVSTLGLCTSCTNITQQVTVSNCTLYYCNDSNCTAPGLESCSFPGANEEALPQDCLRWPNTGSFKTNIQYNVSTPNGASFSMDLTDLTLFPVNSTSATLILPPDDGETSEDRVNYITEVSEPWGSQPDEYLDVSKHAFLAATFHDSDVEGLMDIGVCPRLSFTSIIECRLHMCLKIFQHLRMVNGSMLPYNERHILLNWDANATAERLSSMSIYSRPSSSNNGSSEPFSAPSLFQIHVSKTHILINMVNSLFDSQSADTWTGLWIGNVVARGMDVSKLMAAIADSVTNLIRTGPNRTDIQGTAYYPEVFVVVRWQWCILPGALVVLSVVFFSLTIWTTRAQHGSQTPLWKSNLLPFLFHGLEGWTREEMRVSENSTAMEEAAQGMVARMKRNDDGELKFMKVDDLRGDRNLDRLESQTSAEEGMPLSTINSQPT